VYVGTSNRRPRQTAAPTTGSVPEPRLRGNVHGHRRYGGQLLAPAHAATLHHAGLPARLLLVAVQVRGMTTVHPAWFPAGQQIRLHSVEGWKPEKSLSEPALALTWLVGG
jgi:hypothetical protein